MEIYIDGGVKKGTDIFKCLALGADFVFLGRGFLYSIVEGEEGISKSFEILKNELRIAMGLCGVTRIEDITENYVKTKEPYSKL